MKLRYKILGGLLALTVVALSALALVVSHNSACEPAPVIAAGASTMKAVVYRCYGSPDVLELEDIEKPIPADKEVLVKIKAASVNPLDWHYMRGSPYIMRLEYRRFKRHIARILQILNRALCQHLSQFT